MTLNPWNSAGDRNKNAKLTWELVRAMRSEFRLWNGDRKRFFARWAKRVGVTEHAIDQVVRGVRWKDVPEQKPQHEMGG